MSAHSPGPWRYGEGFGEEWWTDARGNAVFMSDPANHRIVEDATEMLALLRRLDAVTPKHPPPGQCGCIVCDARGLLARIDGATKEE